ncbi:Peroxisomal biogenesis factor 11 gamma [Mactra antiquata]
MDKLIQLIGGYRERDKFIRLCQYILKFVAGTGQTKLGAALGKIADELSNCRAVLRLFDDVPMLAYTLRYGLGKKEPNSWMRLLELVSNCANQLYFPLEHVSWLAKKQIINRDGYPWGVACIVAWGTALLSEILKAISRIYMIRNAQKVLLKEQNLDTKHESEPSEMSHDIKSQMRMLKAKECDNYLAVLEHSADFINAVNWLPPGILWSGKFSAKFTGGMGTISSAIKFYRLHSAKW